jgi:mscL: large conductance mechanosensitive channel protein
LPWRAMW